MPATAAYLTKYLTAANTTSTKHGDFEDSSRPKKRRKKDKHVDTGALLIADDDEGLLLSEKTRHVDDDEDGPLVYNGTGPKSAEFRKKKNSDWKTVPVEAGDAQGQNGRAAKQTSNVNVDDEADRILTEAVNESHSRRLAEQDEEAPAIVDAPTQEDDGPKMSSGVKAGLQTAADTQALLDLEAEREEAESQKSKKKKARQKEDEHPAEETIYRDATGRRIDISLRRQEARAAELAKIAAEKKEKEAAMGEVQLRQREERKQELDEAKFLTLGRTAEDEELNERQKEELRWDDPMAAYIAQEKAERAAEEEARNPKARRKGRDVDDGVVVRVRKREYQGAAPPNRYGIKPGWRWDGVDRGNGFEKEWFQARGKKSRNENLEYQWQMDE